MSFLKQLLSPFVQFDEDKKKDTPKVSPSTATQYNEPTVENAEHPLITGRKNTIIPNQQKSVSSTGVITNALPEHVQYFEKLIDTANATNPIFQGTDYKEFTESKADIDSIMDEETKYRTAFNVLKRTGLTREKLLSTAQEYHNIIGRDMNAFQSAHAQKYLQDVGQTEQLIQKKAEELQSLSIKINALKKDISQLSQNLTETKDKLNVTKNSFLLAGENKQNEIQQEVQKIEKYF
ncbi:MAG: hypothetical protein ABIN89_16270 [Chitinophagaceae bacterium]